MPPSPAVLACRPRLALGDASRDHAGARRTVSEAVLTDFDSLEADTGHSTSHGTPIPLAPYAPGRRVSFDRAELAAIFALYGRMVAAGEWRDYALDFLRDKAVFSVFRRAAEMPLYRIEKTPRLARKQGTYAVIAASGLILKRGPELSAVLRRIDRPLRLVKD